MTTPCVHPDLDQRSLDIIKALVEENVNSDAPVASSTIAAAEGINLSPASVRSVLSRLEDCGYIKQVHTSSGRVPTTEGLRVYVNSLVRLQQPSPGTRAQLASELDTHSTNTMAASAMAAVANLTQMVSIVSLPSMAESRLASIQFVHLSRHRVMAVLVTTDGEVRNQLLECTTDISTRNLELAAQFFNENFGGMTPTQARTELSGRIGNLQLDIAKLLQGMLTSITGAGNGPREMLTPDMVDLHASAQMLADNNRLQEMLALLQSKQALLAMLDQGASTANVSVFIGVESGVAELADSSVVTAPYTDENRKVVGVLGLIGPRNMSYGKLMPIMELTAGLMNEALAKIRADLS